MGYYAIGDIHGCYDEFMQMLKAIDFNLDYDKLFFVGDYIDRGPKSYEMLKWLEEWHLHANLHFVRGNHEEEFVAYVDLLNSVDSDLPQAEVYKKLKERSEYFDMYGTVGDLISHGYGDELTKWADMFRHMDTAIGFHYLGKHYVIVHAGFRFGSPSGTTEEFRLYAREEAYTKGGMRLATVIAGHTPTLIKGEFTYNDGNVFTYYNEEKKCTFYDIDCGCCFRKKDPRGKLACIGLDDNEIYYV